MNRFSESRATRRAFWAGLGLAALATTSLAAVLTRQVGAQAPQPAPGQASQPAFGEPVKNANPYAPRRLDGELHAEHVRGKVWVLTGQPGESNVLVQLGDDGVIIVDTGTK